MEIILILFSAGLETFRVSRPGSNGSVHPTSEILQQLHLRIKEQFYSAVGLAGRKTGLALKCHAMFYWAWISA
jgi:hypothetical protein